MATLSSAKSAAGVPARKGIAEVSVYFSYALAAALVDEDLIRLCKIPAGAVITDFRLFVPDLDTNVSPAIALNVGDETDPNRYVAGSTVGQAVGTIGFADFIPAAVGFEYTADDYLVVEVETAPATGAATGTIKGVVRYTQDA